MYIKLTYPSEFVLRQTPGCMGIWEQDTFFTGSQMAQCDAWVIYEYLPEPEYVFCDPSRTVFITGEPSSVRRYDSRFLSQFGAVITPRADIIHPYVIRQQPSIPWWVGLTVDYPEKRGYRLDYDFFKSLGKFPKPKRASIITSSRTTTDYHRKRGRFVQHLKEHFADDLDVFGHGWHPVSDKWDAIYPYKYNIVLENSSSPHYWSEKIADAFLGGSYPLYNGCPNLSDYFPKASFREINMDNPKAAIATIHQVIYSNEYEKAMPHIQAARELVLNKFNLFPMLSAVLSDLPRTSINRVSLRPENHFTDPLTKRVRRKLKRLIAN